MRDVSRHRVALVPLTVVAIAAAVLGADELTKRWARHALSDHARHVLGPLWWRLQFNSGVSFSLGASSAPWAVMVSSAVLVGVLIAAVRSAPGSASVGWGLVLGGGLANLWDRLLSPIHEVTDFVALGRFPVFNVADSAVTVGFVVLMVLIVRGRRVFR